jgi:hypothetical protein
MDLRLNVQFRLDHSERGSEALCVPLGIAEVDDRSGWRVETDDEDSTVRVGESCGGFRDPASFFGKMVLDLEAKSLRES